MRDLGSALTAIGAPVRVGLVELAHQHVIALGAAELIQLRFKHLEDQQYVPQQADLWALRALLLEQDRKRLARPLTPTARVGDREQTANVVTKAPQRGWHRGIRVKFYLAGPHLLGPVAQKYI